MDKYVMFCEKYRCSMSERTCIARREVMKKHVWAPGAIENDPGCRGCEQGEKIAESAKLKAESIKLKAESSKLKGESQKVKGGNMGDQSAEGGVHGAEGMAQSAVKRCSKCGKEKPVEEFYKNNVSRDGLDYRCKTCKNEYQQALKANKKKQPRQEAPEKDYLVIDLSKFPEVLERIRKEAEDELRTPENHVIYLLKSGFLWEELLEVNHGSR